MANDVLHVDTGVLRDAGAVLRGVAATLLAAPATADPTEDVVAHPVLRERLRHVGQGWDDRRTAAAKTVDGLAEAVAAAAGLYEHVDDALCGDSR